jgi:uncharacterized protein
VEQTSIQIAQHTLLVDVAWLPEAKRLGLSTHSCMPECGLLFLFDPPEYAGVGMQAMHFAISVGFISADLKLLAWHDLEPGTEVLQPSQPVIAFIELAQGWFAQRGIEAGAAIQIPELGRWIRPRRPIGFRLPSA